MVKIELLEPSIISIINGAESYLAYFSAKNIFEMNDEDFYKMSNYPINPLFVDNLSDQLDENLKHHCINKRKIANAEPRQMLTSTNDIKTIEIGTPCQLLIGTMVKITQNNISKCGHILRALDVRIL